MTPIPPDAPARVCQSCRAATATHYVRLGNGTRQTRCAKCASRAAVSGFTKARLREQ